MKYTLAEARAALAKGGHAVIRHGTVNNKPAYYITATPGLFTKQGVINFAFGLA